VAGLGAPQAVQAQGQPHHAECAETKVGAEPKKVCMWPWLHFDPAKSKSKKRQSKTNRGCSGQAQKPFVRHMTLTPHGSRDYEFENADAHCHDDQQERDRTKANCKTKNAVKDQSECAKSKAVQDQKPRFALPGTPQAGSDRASSSRKCELTQKHNGTLQRIFSQSQGSIRFLHKKVHG